MNILIVEDEPRLADALGEIMREQHYLADVVYTGTDGLDYAQNGIGSESCGPRLLEQYRLDDAAFDFGLRLIPEKK